MKCRFDTRRIFSLLLLGLAAASLAGGALAADTPKRKSGLWEINTQMEGIPNMGAMQQCIDQNTDNLMQQQAKKEKVDCSVMDFKAQGNKFTLHSVCKFEGTTATTDAVFIGTFDSAYKGDMNIRYNPPMHGISESKMTMEAKWLGPCKPGQKPGDVIMPNMKNMNFNEMMKDPKIREMMKQQK
ncbi:hypothetical protein SCD_n02362 [Sulfuricella denitrificans skB26]|uniref:DUF3617 family protein n=1 Tax=Sulfuricella denitrificans (strain DSM 22764 / NBRC 105220 / skB26) TaxID=1163617 RepID=S6AAR1_SULDS|nr:DUF3617 family protein [Sulfuricella denitrificans]BAN36170.1 hypothetical protein SCD_n02362 [Sulfuricella denitrificans skB26]